MIVVPVLLLSAQTGETTSLGVMTISNIGGDYHTRNYDCKMYRKGTEFHKLATAKPTRECQVLNHKSVAEPVHNLVSKALTEMGYG